MRPRLHRLREVALAAACHLGLVSAADHRREIGRLQEHYRTARRGELEAREELERRVDELELLLSATMSRADAAFERDVLVEERLERERADRP